MKKENRDETYWLKPRDFTPKGALDYAERVWNADDSEAIQYNIGLYVLTSTYAITSALLVSGIEKLLN